jgi:two-component system nitrate/nitrite response regulator NarL
MEVIGIATNRRDALAAAVRHQPDVVLVDIALGDDCELDLLLELQSRCQAKPIVFTGMNDPELRERGVLLGARDVLHKMESAEVILKAIEFVRRGELWLDRVAITGVVDTLRAASEHKPTTPATSGFAALTQKERQVVGAVVEHKGRAQQGNRCRPPRQSAHAAQSLATIYSKLDVRNRMELLIYANEQGLHKIRHKT